MSTGGLGALDVGGWSTPRPAALLPGTTPFPLYRRLGGPQGLPGEVQNISPPPRSDPRNTITNNILLNVSAFKMSSSGCSLCLANIIYSFSGLCKIKTSFY